LVPRSARFRSFFFTGLAAGAAAGEVAGAAVAPACCCVAELVDHDRGSGSTKPGCVDISNSLLHSNDSNFKAVHVANECASTRLKHTEHIRGTML